MEFRQLDRETFIDMIPQIVRLHDRCFGEGATQKYFCWRYLDNPIKDLLVNVAIDKGKLAAFYAVSPLVLTYHGEKWKAALSLNTMTDAEYAGRGLFTALAQETYHQLELADYVAVIGFSNVHSNHIFNTRLQFQTVYEVPMLEFPLESVCVKAAEIEFDNDFLLGYPLQELETSRISVEKSQAYLQWRYAQSPENTYKNIVIKENGEVKAFAVFKVWKDRLNVVEFHVENSEYMVGLLQSCMDYGWKIGCRYITIWAPINTELHHLLEKKKFINRYPIHYFIAKSLNNFDKKVDVLDPRNWAIQMGDNNTY